MSAPENPQVDPTEFDHLVEPSDNGPEDGADTPSQDPNFDPNAVPGYDGPEL